MGTRFKFNLTAIANLANCGQGIKIILLKSETFSLGDQNDEEQDRVYHFLHHRVWYNMYDIGNPGTYILEAQLLFAFCKSATVPELFKTKLPKETLHIQGLSLP